MHTIVSQIYRIPIVEIEINLSWLIPAVALFSSLGDLADLQDPQLNILGR